MGEVAKRVAASARAAGAWFRRPIDGRLWLFLGTGLVLFLILAFKSPTGVDLRVGEVAARDIEAPRSVVNRVATERLRAEAARESVRNAANHPKTCPSNTTVGVLGACGVRGR